MLSQLFEKQLKSRVADLPTWQASQQRPRGTLLILDRSLDALCPLMHEYTYQAMCNDLVRIKGELCYLDDQRTKSADELLAESESPEAAALVLSEDDELWLEYRHKHIGEVMHSITEKFKEFKGMNRMAALQSTGRTSSATPGSGGAPGNSADTSSTEGEKTVKNMLAAMRSMPEYKSMMKKYHKHMSLAQVCMTKFETKHLKELGELEQDMATGLTNDGKAINVKAIKSQLIRLCTDETVSLLDKLRLLMIYIISQGGISDSTRKELMKNMSVSLQRAIRNLEKLGVDLTSYSASNKSRSRHSSARLNEFVKRNKNIPMALMRYVPVLYSLTEQLIQHHLSQDLFPYTSPPPEDEEEQMATHAKQAMSQQNKSRDSIQNSTQGKSARKKRDTQGSNQALNLNSDWKSSAAAGASTDEPQGVTTAVAAQATFAASSTQPRYYVFVLGGMTFSEMRSVYELSDDLQSNVYLGSTSTLTPNQYIRDLSDLSDTDFREALLQSTVESGQPLSTDADTDWWTGEIPAKPTDTEHDDTNNITLQFNK